MSLILNTWSSSQQQVSWNWSTAKGAWQPVSCPKAGEGWYRQPCCQGRAVAETSLSHDNKSWCSLLTVGKCSEKGASDTGVFLTKPAKSMFQVSYGHGKAQSQTDGNQNSFHVPGLHQRGVSGVTTSALLTRPKRKTSMFSDMAALPCRREDTERVLLPALGLTRLLGSRPAWYRCPRSPGLWVCLSQPREKPRVRLAAWILSQESPAWGSCTNRAWFWEKWCTLMAACLGSGEWHVPTCCDWYWLLMGSNFSWQHSEEFLFSYFDFHEWISNSKTHARCYWPHKMWRAGTVFSIPLSSLWAH